MIAYNKNELYHLYVRSIARQAFQNEGITKEEYAAVCSQYPSKLYTPNFFISIALFLLTVVIVIFSIGIFALGFLGDSSEDVVTILALFFSAACFFILEVFIRQRHHYFSGVDTALLECAAILLLSGLVYATDAGPIIVAAYIFIISLLCTLRYAHPFMSVSCMLSFLAIIYLVLSQEGGYLKAITAFVLMAISIVIYFIFKNKKEGHRFNEYDAIFNTIEICSLLTFYLAGNFFVVNQYAGNSSSLSGNAVVTFPLAYFFWVCTIIIPLVYIYFGIKNKNSILLRVGLVLLAAMVFTIRYYYSHLSIEIVLVLGGAAMILVAWALTRFLQPSKYGFTSVELHKNNAPAKAQLEALILAQTFAKSPLQNNNSKFSGGDFGGAGATGEY